MFETLLILGIACVVAAGASGGLKLKGIWVPPRDDLTFAIGPGS